jgi:hypothetical protein
MRRPVPFALALAALLGAGKAPARTVSTSPGPDAVSVTIYRAPYRAAARPLDLEWLDGYALITETRRVSIPAGESDLRFEGVAGGILPESAIVTGLPDGVVEKNQDAYLLSPASLLDRTLGRRVHIRRTSRATGAVIEEEAVIRTSAQGGVVVQTRHGVEALHCTGLPETLVYDRVPEGLSAKPTLSVRTRSQRAASATVTLSYLASNFDWQANYVATISPAGDRIDLFAWVTLANGDETSFANADTQTVAGRLNRETDQRERPSPPDPQIDLRCWPAATTSQIRSIAPPAPPAEARDNLNSLSPVTVIGAEEISVTGSRMARQEELGDLKLYRIPEPVTVASRSQKQVAMFDRKKVPVEVYYRGRVSGDGSQGGVMLMLRALNRTEKGLGLPLPAGRIALFQPAGGRPMLLGESSLEDHAVGEKVEIEVREAENLSFEADSEKTGRDTEKVTLTVTNPLPEPILFEAEIRQREAERLSGFGRGVVRDEGKWIWRVRVPANATRKTSYRFEDVD